MRQKALAGRKLAMMTQDTVTRLGAVAALLGATIFARPAPASGAPGTYVDGSLIDASGGSGVSTPIDASTNVSVSDGRPGVYGEISITTSTAVPEWVYDLGTIQTIASDSFWSWGAMHGISQMPSGDIRIYAASALGGPYSEIAAVTRSMIRDTVPPNSQATDGEGFRIPCSGPAGRYLKIRVTTPDSMGGLDNVWRLRLVSINEPIVVHGFQDASGDSDVNDFPRIPYNIVDGALDTMWNPLRTDLRLVLDLGPLPRRFQTITFQPNAGDGAFLPQKGEVRVSSNDDPDNMDLIVGLFDIGWADKANDPATIILPKVFEKRFVEVHWTSVREPTYTQTRIAEVAVDTVPAAPSGVSAASCAALPDDGIDDAVALQTCLDQYHHVLLSAGTYNLGAALKLPSDSSLTGQGINITFLQLTVDKVAIRVLGNSRVRMSGFNVNRPFDASAQEAIFVRADNGNYPTYIEVDHVRVTNNRSRAPAIALHDVTNGSITDSDVYDSQRLMTNEPYPSTPDPYPGQTFSFVFGNGVQVISGSNIYLASNTIVETRDMRDTSHVPPNGAYYQASGIVVSASRNVVVRANYVERTGTNLDTSGSQDLYLDGNALFDCHDVCIKLVNGSSRITLHANMIWRAGLAGVWLATGNTGLSATYNNLDDNDFHEIGQGYGQGFWAPYLWWAVVGIALDKADSVDNAVRFNTIQNNDFYANAYMREAVFEHPGPVAPSDNIFYNNNIH